MKIRCAIIDDEHLARQYLKDYVSKVPFLELQGDYNSPLKVLDLLKSGKLDLLFLDIQMPDITGLDFIKTLDHPPHIILTTAYKEYALEGYELNVTDYLLKPFSFERFLKAVNKVAELSEQTSETPVINNENTNDSAEIFEDYLMVRADRKYYKINYDDLIYIEGQKAYVTFQTKKDTITALASLKDLEKKLPLKYFIRIHKSFIVSIKHIQAIDGNSIEIGKKYFPIGQSYLKNVQQVLKLKE